MRNPIGPAGIPCLLFLVSFQFLLRGLNPTFYMDDSPEIVTSCFNWGISHPPGYPLLNTLGRLFTLLPVGHIPFRINLMVAALAAATVALLFILLRHALKTPPLPTALLALMWITGSAVYSNALSSKGGVYHLASLLLVSILLALLKHRLDAALFLLGLSLSNHWMTAAAAAPGLLLLGWPVANQDRGRWRIWAPGLLGFLAGISLLLVLPLRAVFHPAPNFGDPSSWGRLLSHLALEQFKGIQTLRIPGEVLPQIGTWILHLLKDWPLAFPLALFGIVVGWKEDRKRATGFLLVWAVMAATVNYGFPFSARRFEFNYTTQLFPSCLPLIVFAAIAVSRFVANPSDGRRSRFSTWIAFLLGMALIAGVLRSGPSQSTYTFVHDFGVNALQAVPRGGALFAKGDAIVFTQWYLQWVEGRRPDVVVTTVENLPTPWYRDRLRRDHPDAVPPEPKGVLPLYPIPVFMRPWAVTNRHRGLYFSYNQLKDDGLGDAQLAPRGLLQQAFLPPEEASFREEEAAGLWGRIRIRHVLEDKADELTRHHLLVDYAVARSLTGMRKFGEAMQERSKGRSPKDVVRRFRSAHLDFAWAHGIAPGEEGYVYNAGLSLYNAGDWAASLPWFEKAAQLNPTHVEAYYIAGMAAMNAGDTQKAGNLFEAVLKLRPGLTDARKQLDGLIKKGLYRAL